MKMGRITPAARPRRLGATTCAIALAALITGAGLAATAAPPAHAVGKGILDHRLDSTADPAARDAMIRDLAGPLGVRWIRIVALWSTCEPERGVYNEAALARLDALVDALRGEGVRVVLTTYSTPRWASDSSYWNRPPAGLGAGYSPRYPVRDDALADFGRFGEVLAARFAGRVTAIECWNEPNLWPYIYPQRTATDPEFGARTYLTMLKAFAAGVRRANAAQAAAAAATGSTIAPVRVVAGATAPVGLDDTLRTSPQKFARFLASKGAAAHFDIYSHHPYTPGGSIHPAPDKPPNDPTKTVTLYNLKTLLKLFPGKPFYLTEYGYNTATSLDFGGFAVSEAAQARYLRRAYQYAGRHKQVKALFWYLVGDARPASGDPRYGVYTGLRRPDGSRKPSWYAYAGGNRVSLLAPTRVRRGTVATVKGRLTNAATGPVGDQAVTVQGRRAGTRRWYALAKLTPGSDGRFAYRQKLTRATQFRVLWSGVSTSPVRTVSMR